MSDIPAANTIAQTPKHEALQNAILEAHTITDRLDSLISLISTGRPLDTELQATVAPEVGSLVDVLDAAPRELAALTSSARERIDTLSTLLF